MLQRPTDDTAKQLLQVGVRLRSLKNFDLADAFYLGLNSTYFQKPADRSAYATLRLGDWRGNEQSYLNSLLSEQGQKIPGKNEPDQQVLAAIQEEWHAKSSDLLDLPESEQEAKMTSLKVWFDSRFAVRVTDRTQGPLEAYANWVLDRTAPPFDETQA